MSAYLGVLVISCGSLGTALGEKFYLFLYLKTGFIVTRFSLLLYSKPNRALKMLGTLRLGVSLVPSLFNITS